MSDRASGTFGFEAHDSVVSVHPVQKSTVRQDESDLQVREGTCKAQQITVGRRHHLLVLRFSLINIVGFAVLGAADLQGWVETVLAGDQTRVVVIILGLFLFGLSLCAWRIVRTSNDLEHIKACEPLRSLRVGAYISAVRGRTGESRSLFAESLKLKSTNRIAIVRHIANALVLLGLIGTVLGFIIALSGVDARLVSDVTAIGPMVSTLISGMSVALFTTLVGAVFNIWLMVNYRLLLSGTVNLITAIVELGERYARD